MRKKGFECEDIKGNTYTFDIGDEIKLTGLEYKNFIEILQELVWWSNIKLSYQFVFDNSEVESRNSEGRLERILSLKFDGVYDHVLHRVINNVLNKNFSELLFKMSTVKILSLSNCNIGPIGANEIMTALINANSIEQLNLSNNYMGEENISDLVKLISIPSLSKLELKNCLYFASVINDQPTTSELNHNRISQNHDHEGDPGYDAIKFKGMRLAEKTENKEIKGEFFELGGEMLKNPFQNIAKAFQSSQITDFDISENWLRLEDISLFIDALASVNNQCINLELRGQKIDDIDDKEYNALYKKIKEVQQVAKSFNQAQSVKTPKGKGINYFEQYNISKVDNSNQEERKEQLAQDKNPLMQEHCNEEETKEQPVQHNQASLDGVFDRNKEKEEKLKLNSEKETNSGSVIPSNDQEWGIALKVISKFNTWQEALHKLVINLSLDDMMTSMLQFSLSGIEKSNVVLPNEKIEHSLADLSKSFSEAYIQEHKDAALTKAEQNHYGGLEVNFYDANLEAYSGSGEYLTA